MRAACSGAVRVCALRACVAESMRADPAYLGACFCNTCGLAAVLAVHGMLLGVRAHFHRGHVLPCHRRGYCSGGGQQHWLVCSVLE